MKEEETKNSVNQGITKEKLIAAVDELFTVVGFRNPRNLFQYQNVLVQGINRDGTIRLTLIDI